MCEICHSIPCLSGCPNASPKMVARCKMCGEPICEGDSFLDIGDTICETCLEDMSAMELVKAMGESLTAA